MKKPCKKCNNWITALPGLPDNGMHTMGHYNNEGGCVCECHSTLEKKVELDNTEEAILKEFDNLDKTQGRVAWENSIKPFISQVISRVRESTLEEVMQKYEASIKQNMQDELVVTANFMISLKNMVKEQLNELRSNTK